MKKLLFVLLVFCMSTIKAQWTDISIPTNKPLTRASFVNDLDGFVTSSYSKVLYRTNDGGQNWDSITFNENIIDVEFLSTYEGFILLRENNILSLKKTTDGGNVWNNITIPSSQWSYLNSVMFTNSNTGFLFTNDAKVYTTNNGGTTWDSVMVGGYTMVNDKEKINADTLFFTGWDGTFAYRGSIVHSFDGGNSWTENLTNQNYTNFDGTHFRDGQNGYGVYHSGWGPDTAYLAKTLDGGLTWNIFHYDTSMSYQDVYIKNDLEGYVLTTNPMGTVGKIRSTTDGINWIDEFTTLPMSRFYHAENTLYAIGSNGTVVKKSVPLSISKLSKNNLQVSPNPSNGLFQFNTDMQNYTIEVYSTLGQLVFSSNKIQSNEINLSYLANGTYLMILKNDLEILQTKLILQK